MKLNEILTEINSIVASAAILVGGTWAIYNFGLQRIRKPIVTLEIECAPISVSSDSAASHISIIVRNQGRTGVAQNYAFVEIAPVLLPSLDGNRIAIASVPISQHTEKHPIFKSHTFLEPGEQFKESLLINVAKEVEYLRIRAIFSASKPVQSWYTETTISASHS